MRAQELVRRAQEYISAHATQQEFRRRFLQIRLFLLRLFASLILGPTESFNFFTSQSRVEVCTESFFTHKQFHKTARLFSATTLSVIVASVVIISLILNLTISPALVGRAATFTSSWTTYNDFYYKTGGAGDASTQSNVTIADSGNPTNATLGTVKLSYLSTVIDSADTASNWVSSNETSLAVSQETTDKQEGTGSTKMVQTIATAIDGGTGADGTLDLSLGSGAGGCNGSGLSWSGVTCTIAIATKSTFNFTTINIPADTILTTDGPSITSNAVTIKATGNVTVAGAIDLAGRGYAGGQSGHDDGYGPGAGIHGTNQSGSPSRRGGGGGGGYGGAGGNGGTDTGRGAGGSAYTGFDSGSGAGRGAQAVIPVPNGGPGGGGIKIISTGTVTVSGNVNVNGGNGTSPGSGGGGGGGSGGAVTLQAANLTVSGTITANGGNGANYVNTSSYDGGGGGGGGGRITLEYSGTLNTAGSTITVSGGTYGTGDSTAAAVGSDGVLTQTSISGLGTATVTKAPALDLSGYSFVKFWIKSSRTGQYMQMQIGESTASENTYNITINAADTWEQKTWDISGIADTSKDAITKAALAVTDATTGFTVYVDDVNVDGYPTSGTVSNLILDSGGTSLYSTLSWDADTAPTGTSVKFRIRTASSQGGLSSATWSGYATTSPTTVSSLSDPPSDNRWAELEIALATTNQANTPTLNSLTMTYVRNAAPAFDSTFGGGTGVTVSENSNGTVAITYSVRDEDTNSNNTSVASGAMAGYIRPIQSDNATSGFEYNTGSGWSAITSTYLANGASDIDRQSVDTTVCNPITSICPAYTQHSVTWDAKGQINGIYTASAQVRVTANDNEVAYNTTTATVSNITIDTKNPDYTGIVPIVLDAANNQLTLKITDNSAVAMKISNSSNLAADGSNADSGSFIAYGTDANSDGYGDTPLSATVTKSWTPASGTAPLVYAQYKDIYSNTTSIVSATAPVQPQNMVIRDLSNLSTSEYRLFVAWQKTDPVPSPGFKHYRVMRSTTNESGYAQYGSLITDIDTNYILDTTVSADTTYYYKVYVEDNDGNRSKYSSSVNDKANGQGGTDVTPPTVTVPPSASGVTTNSATITWTTDELSNSQVDYSTEALFATSPYSTPAVSSAMVVSHSVVLTGLSPATAYKYRVKSIDPSTNTVTDNNSGAAYSFTTSAGPAISAVSVTSVANTTATIKWNTNTASDSNVDYSVNSNLSSSSNAGSSTPVTSHSVNLTGLTSGTKYYFQVSSTVSSNTSLDNNGTSYYTFTTTSDTAPPVISTVSAVNIGATFATIAWTTDEASTSQVEYGLTSAYGSTTTENTDLVTSHGVRLTGLTVNTTYHYRVISKDGSNNSTTGGDNTFPTTLTAGVDSTAPAISSVAVSSIYSTQATVTWTTDERANSIVDYSVDLSFSNSKQDTSIGTSHSVTISGLTPDTAYKVRVRSVDSAENSTTDNNSGAGYPFSTTPGAVISDVSVASTSGVNATVTWTTDISSNSYVDYSLNSSLSNSASAWSDLLATKHSVTLTGLTSSAKYYFRVRSLATINSVSRTALDDNGGSYYYFSTTTDTTAPSITAVEAVNIGETFASITWTTSEPTTSQVEYGLTSAYGSTTTVNTGLVASHNVRLSGLTINTPYHYRVISADASGNSTTSTDKVFTTLASATALTGGGGGGGALPDDTAPTISEVTAKALSPTSAIISWVTNEFGTSFVETTVKGSSSTDIHGGFAPNLKHAVTIRDGHLQSNTTYIYHVISQDSAGNLAQSRDDTFTTPAAPGGEVASSITKESEQKSQEIETKKEEKKTVSAPIEPKLLTEARETIVRGITSFLQAEPSSKDFVYPLLEAFEQVSDTIPAPRIIGPLPVIDLSPTTATITWTTDRGGNSLVAYASVSDYSSSRQEPYTQVVGNPDEHITSHTVKVLGLMPATLYHYQLRTNPHFGAIAESKDFTFTTPAQTPEISSASPKIIGQNSASFTWTTNLLTDSVVRYTPVVDGKPQTSQAKVQGSTELTTTHNVTVVDLKPGAKYEVEIISRDAYGNQIAQKLPSINTGEDKEPPVISQIRTSSAVVPGKTIAIQTIISWKTDEPATSQVTWQEGAVGNKDLERTTPLLNSLTTDHLVVITQFQPATVYRFFVKSADSAGNEALSRTFTILTPRQEQTVLQIIVKNFQDIFPFTK